MFQLKIVKYVVSGGFKPTNRPQNRVFRDFWAYRVKGLNIFCFTKNISAFIVERHDSSTRIWNTPATGPLNKRCFFPRLRSIFSSRLRRAGWRYWVLPNTSRRRRRKFWGFWHLKTRFLKGNQWKQSPKSENFACGADWSWDLNLTKERNKGEFK